MTSTLAALADPPIRQIDGAAMDYFLIELVATLRESAAVATARSKKVEQEMIEAGLIPRPTPVPSSHKKEKESPARDSVTRTGSAAGGKSVVDEEEEPVRQRLEAIGMHVGANFAERFVSLHFLSFHKLYCDITVCVEINPCFLKPLMPLNSSVKTFGPLAGINRSIIYVQIIGYVKPHRIFCLINLSIGGIRSTRQCF